jgi:hypothetical protein
MAGPTNLAHVKSALVTNRDVLRATEQLHFHLYKESRTSARKMDGK